MMFRRLLALTLAALCIVHISSTRAIAHEFSKGAIKISHPWTRATPAGAKVAGGFMIIENTGATPDRLIGGSAIDAGRFEVHEMTMSGGVMKMRELAKGLEIKPGEKVALKPGSYHVMFMDLKKPLAQGAVINGTLVFEKAGTVEITYKVEAMGARSSDHSKHH